MDSPYKIIKGQESPPMIDKLTAATAQSQWKPVKRKPMDSNVAEALEFMTAVEQLLEKNMMQQRKLCF